MKKQFKLLLAVLAAVILSVCALCFAACSDPDDKNDGTPTDVTGKTYIYVNGSSNSSMVSSAEIDEMYSGATITFNAGGTVTSNAFYGSTWTQDGATVSVDTGYDIVYSGKATGETLTLSASNAGIKLTLNFKLVKPAGSDGDGDGDDKKEPFEGGSVEGYAFTFSELEVIKQGTLPADHLQDMRQSLADSHLVFKTGGVFLMVSEGEAMQGSWTQKGDFVTITMFGTPQDFTVSGNEIILSVEDGDDIYDYSVKYHYAYDADYKYNDGTGDDKKEPFSGDLEGYAFKFSKIEVIKQGTLTTAQLQEMNIRLANSYFVFEEKGKFLAIQSGMSFEGTWVQKGNVATLTIDGDPQDFTVTDNEIVAVLVSEDKDYNYTVKMYYAYDADYKPDGGSGKDDDDEGGSSTVVPGAYMNVSGCSFSYLRYEVVKMGNLTPEDFEHTEERASQCHFVFNKDGTVIVVMHNNVQTLKWEQKENIVILTDDEGYSFELTVNGREIKQVEAYAPDGYEVNFYYTYDPDYKYEPDVPQPPKPDDGDNSNEISVAGKAYTYRGCKTDSEELAEIAEETFRGVSFIFVEENHQTLIYSSQEGTAAEIWVQEGNTVYVGDGEEVIYIFEVDEYGITFDASDGDEYLILIFDYDSKFDFTVLNP